MANVNNRPNFQPAPPPRETGFFGGLRNIGRTLNQVFNPEKVAVTQKPQGQDQFVKGLPYSENSRRTLSAMSQTGTSQTQRRAMSLTDRENFSIIDAARKS